MSSPKVSLDTITSFAKEYGFIFQSSANYGGMQGVYDFGPMGVELKNNLKQRWWRDMVYMRGDVEGLDSAILTSPITLAHSGHVDTFSDLLIDCLNCKNRFRDDGLVDGACPSCKSRNLTQPRAFNLMFKSQLGSVVSENNTVYLRPETAQGIFCNFKHVLDVTSRKLPFGIAQIGKAFRNEITVKSFIFRVREFEQMELEYFVDPDEADQWLEYWVERRFQWWIDQGLDEQNLKKHHQDPSELAHYSKATIDILYAYPNGFAELEGVANRMDFDLGSHTKGQDELEIQAEVLPNSDAVCKMTYKHTDATKKEFVPFVIEPSAGLERGVLALLHNAYTEETLPNGTTRVVLKLKPHLAPIKAAIMTVVKNKDNIVNKGKEVESQLRRLGIGRIQYESTGNIGKAYRRHDAIGTPLCITIDHDTVDSNSEHYNTVTIRHRDSMLQERIDAGKLRAYLLNFYNILNDDYC